MSSCRPALSIMHQENGATSYVGADREVSTRQGNAVYLSDTITPPEKCPCIGICQMGQTDYWFAASAASTMF